MVVIVLEKAPDSLRGYLTRWLIQPRRGVYLGHATARVRERLWSQIRSKIKSGNAIMIWPDRTCPQGYRALQAGKSGTTLEDFDGLLLPFSAI